MDIGEDDDRNIHGAIHLLETCPKAARVRDGDGNLPIHNCCSLNKVQHPAMLEALVSAYPESLKMTNADGNTSLRLACQTRRDDNNAWLIQFLVEQCPEALLVKDNQGETPLQSLLYNMNSWNTAFDGPELLSIVEFMVNACVESAKVLNAKMETLVHFVCKNVNKRFARTHTATYFALLRFLLWSFPEATSLADKLGCLPLHSLCEE